MVSPSLEIAAIASAPSCKFTPRFIDEYGLANQHKEHGTDPVLKLRHRFLAKMTTDSSRLRSDFVDCSTDAGLAVRSIASVCAPQQPPSTGGGRDQPNVFQLGGKIRRVSLHRVILRGYGHLPAVDSAEPTASPACSVAQSNVIRTDTALVAVRPNGAQEVRSSGLPACVQDGC